MSYILEALRKSEQARRHGKVPDLDSVPVMMVGMPAEAARSRLPLAAAAFAAVSVIAVLGWWRPWQEEAAPTTRAVVPEPDAALRAAAQARPGSQFQPASPAPPVIAAQPAVPASPPVLPQAAPMPAPVVAAQPEPVPARPSPAAVAPVVHSPAPAARPVTQPAPPAAPPPAQPAPEMQAPRVARIETRPAIPSAAVTPPAPTATRTAPEPPRADHIYSVHELPPAVRSGLPVLSVSGYSYADEADRRMAVINDRLVQEGEEAGPGVTLARIGSDGVVLEFQGYRFRP